ncbi:MAG TPA: DUF1064 domain-containing protein [Candidatus Angelobacter sp.]|nr:DUF1064 domain-containing protein [Candidatus Angelobacter sp.]
MERRTVLPRASQNKFRARKTTVDGVVFASKHEADRYLELKLLQRAGKISNLILQPAIHYMSQDGRRTLFRYIPDFLYVEAGEYVYEDAKGLQTPVYKLKKKLIEDRYGITIVET